MFSSSSSETSFLLSCFKIQKQLFFFSWMSIFLISPEIFNFFQVFSSCITYFFNVFPGLSIWLSFMSAAFLRCLMMLGCSYLTKILVRSPESWAGCWLQTWEPRFSWSRFFLQHWVSGSVGISFGAGCPVDLLSGAQEEDLAGFSVFYEIVTLFPCFNR